MVALRKTMSWLMEGSYGSQRASATRAITSLSRGGRQTCSEPHVCHAAPVATEVVEGLEPVEMFHGDGADGGRFSEPQVDRDAAAAVFTGRERAPVGDAAAIRAEMKADR